VNDTDLDITANGHTATAASDRLLFSATAGFVYGSIVQDTEDRLAWTTEAIRLNHVRAAGLRLGAEGRDVDFCCRRH